MIDTKEKTIDGVKYAVTQFPGRKAFGIKARLVKLLGPAIIMALGSDKPKPKGKAVTADFDLGAVSRAVQTLAEAMDPEDMVNFAVELVSSTRRNGVEISGEIFDMEFAGKMDVLYQVIAFVIQVNYGSFFKAGGIGTGILAKVQGADQDLPAT